MSLTAKREALYSLSPLLLPWGLIVGGLVFTVLQSLYFFNPFRATPGIGAYIIVLGDKYFWRSLSFTLIVSLITALLSTGIGFLLACLFSRLSPVWRKATLLYKTYLILPHISVAFLSIILFSRTGFISSLLNRTGILADYRQFPSLIFDNRGLGITLGYLIKELPFALLMISALLSQIREDTYHTAHMLGAGPLKVLKEIMWPQAKPAMASSFFILFLYTFGAFEIPFILGGSSPVMLSISVYDKLFRQDFSHRPEAMVMLVIMFIVNLLSLLLFLTIHKRMVWRGGTND